MDHLQLESAVKRLGEGECPNCGNSLTYISNEISAGNMHKNGMVESLKILKERHLVYCKRCGYWSEATVIGLKLIPIDRIVQFDKNWDKKYLEENTLVFGEKGKNPFQD